MFGVLQGPILRPLFFNIFLYELFIIMKETNFASYADNNASCAITQLTYPKIITQLSFTSSKLTIKTLEKSVKYVQS